MKETAIALTMAVFVWVPGPEVAAALTAYGVALALRDVRQWRERRRAHG
jgi:hypothetical protein